LLSSVTISLVPEAKGGPFVFCDDLEGACKTAAALGFDAVEIFPRSAEQLDAGHVQQLLARYRLKVAAIGTGAGWVAHKLRLTDPNPEIRRRALEFCSGMIDFAGRLGAPVIIGSMQGRWEGEISRAQALDWLRAALDSLGSLAATREGGLLFEYLNRYESNLVRNVAEALELLASVSSKRVQLLVDLFHANIEEVSIADALRQAGPRLGHVHFVDSNRRAIGFGHTDMAPIAQALAEINYRGYLSAEVLPLPDTEAAARQTIKAFREFFPAAAKTQP
jgi:sugar phosphate isomerase/epimerase